MFMHLSFSVAEWTSTLIKFLKDQIPKLAEHYQCAVPGTVSDKTPPSQSGKYLNTYTTPISALFQ